MYKHILFDLDGTLTDPAEGIVHSLHHTLQHFGLDALDEAACKLFIGPPLFDSFREVCGLSEDMTNEAIGVYREHHVKIGLFENQVFPGITEMLQKLREEGRMLYVATLKLTSFAETVLQHLGLRSYFTKVVGGNPDGTIPVKADIIGEILREIPEGEKKETVMVGDRKYDVIGARAHNMDSIAVAYGYGSMEELQVEHPTYLINTVADLADLLFKGKKSQA